METTLKNLRHYDADHSQLRTFLLGMPLTWQVFFPVCTFKKSEISGDVVDLFPEIMQAKFTQLVQNSGLYSIESCCIFSMDVKLECLEKTIFGKCSATCRRISLTKQDKASLRLEIEQEASQLVAPPIEIAHLHYSSTNNLYISGLPHKWPAIFPISTCRRNYILKKLKLHCCPLWSSFVVNEVRVQTGQMTMG